MWRSHSGCAQFAEWLLCITSAEILMREAEEESPTPVCDVLPVTQLVSERQGWVCNLSLLNLDSMLFLLCHAVFISRVCDSVALFTH